MYYPTYGTSVTLINDNRPSLTIKCTPEPASVLLLALGLMPMLRRRGECFVSDEFTGLGVNGPILHGQDDIFWIMED